MIRFDFPTDFLWGTASHAARRSLDGLNVVG